MSFAQKDFRWNEIPFFWLNHDLIWVPRYSAKTCRTKQTYFIWSFDSFSFSNVRPLTLSANGLLANWLTAKWLLANLFLANWLTAKWLLAKWRETSISSPYLDSTSGQKTAFLRSRPGCPDQQKPVWLVCKPVWPVDLGTRKWLSCRWHQPDRTILRRSRQTMGSVASPGPRNAARLGGAAQAQSSRGLPVRIPDQRLCFYLSRSVLPDQHHPGFRRSSISGSVGRWWSAGWRSCSRSTDRWSARMPRSEGRSSSPLRSSLPGSCWKKLIYSCFYLRQWRKWRKVL